MERSPIVLPFSLPRKERLGGGNLRIPGKVASERHGPRRSAGTIATQHND